MLRELSAFAAREIQIGIELVIKDLHNDKIKHRLTNKLEKSKIEFT